MKRNKKFSMIILIMMSMLLLVAFNTTNVSAMEFTSNLNESEIQSLNNVLAIIYMIMSGFCGVGIISSVATFAKCAFSLAKSGSGKERSEAYQDILHCVVYTACLASAPSLYGLLLAIFI